MRLIANLKAISWSMRSFANTAPTLIVGGRALAGEGSTVIVAIKSSSKKESVEYKLKREQSGRKLGTLKEGKDSKFEEELVKEGDNDENDENGKGIINEGSDCGKIALIDRNEVKV